MSKISKQCLSVETKFCKYLNYWLKMKLFCNRVGLQEILDAMRDSDAKSDIKIQSEALENIVTALDARHLFGNYHPAMTLKARIERLEGVNTGNKTKFFFLKFGFLNIFCRTSRPTEKTKDWRHKNSKSTGESERIERDSGGWNKEIPGKSTLDLFVHVNLTLSLSL